MHLLMLCERDERKATDRGKCCMPAQPKTFREAEVSRTVLNADYYGESVLQIAELRTSPQTKATIDT